MYPPVEKKRKKSTIANVSNGRLTLGTWTIKTRTKASKQNAERVGSGFSSWFNMVVESCRNSDYFCFFSDLGSKVMRCDQGWGRRW